MTPGENRARRSSRSGWKSICPRPWWVPIPGWVGGPWVPVLWWVGGGSVGPNPMVGGGGGSVGPSPMVGGWGVRGVGGGSQSQVSKHGA